MRTFTSPAARLHRRRWWIASAAIGLLALFGATLLVASAAATTHSGAEAPAAAGPSIAAPPSATPSRAAPRPITRGAMPAKTKPAPAPEQTQAARPPMPDDALAPADCGRRGQNRVPATVQGTVELLDAPGGSRIATLQPGAEVHVQAVHLCIEETWEEVFFWDGAAWQLGVIPIDNTA